MLNNKLADVKLKDKIIYYYSGSHIHKRTNAAYLVSSWSLLYLNKNPEDAFKPFKAIANTFALWHDATPTVCTFQLTILDTLKGLYKARECGFFNFDKFNIEEYEFYEQVENGDFNWCMEGKFIAFAGPHATKEVHPGGYHTLCPDDYIPYFKRKNVTLVIRLNKKYYDAKRFTSHGINHVELYFLDGSNPPDNILAKFLTACEETPGAVAVHCKAGLGRTGSCIGSYMMKHYRFTAEEVIGWLRIVRPGSIIGPQQQFMRDTQMKMWREGELYRARLTDTISSSNEGSELHGSKRIIINSAMSPATSITSKLSGISVTGDGMSSTRHQLIVERAKEKEDSVEESGGITQGDTLRARRQQLRDEGSPTGSMSTSSSASSSPSTPPKSSKYQFLSTWKK